MKLVDKIVIVNQNRILKERLVDIGIKNITIKQHEGIGEVLAPHYEIKVGPEAIAFVYEPLACHSYNVVNIAGKNIRIATLDTMLSFYLTFLYSDRKYYNNDRIICMSEFLYRVQERNRLEQRGILRRFSINCYGKQTTKEDIRTHKTELFEKYKNDRNSAEWEWNFLKYVPKDNVKKTKITKKSKTKKSKTKKSKTKKAKKPKSKKVQKRKPKTKKAKNKKRNKKSNRFLSFY